MRRILLLVETLENRLTPASAAWYYGLLYFYAGAGEANRLTVARTSVHDARAFIDADPQYWNGIGTNTITLKPEYQDTSIGSTAVHLLDGDDVAWLDAGTLGNLVFAGDGDDEIFLGNYADIVYGEDGNDICWLRGGSNFAFGGSGNDRLIGGGDADFLDGGLGDDEIMGEEGDDIVYGGAESDRIFGHEGNDLIYGYEFAPVGAEAGLLKKS